MPNSQNIICLLALGFHNKQYMNEINSQKAL